MTVIKVRLVMQNGKVIHAGELEALPEIGSLIEADHPDDLFEVVQAIQSLRSPYYTRDAEPVELWVRYTNFREQMEITYTAGVREWRQKT